MRNAQAQKLRQFVFRAEVLALCLAATACAAVPDGHEIIAAKQETAAPAAITGARGPLSAEESAAILKGIGATDALRRHLAIEQAVTESALVAGNSTRVLQDGKETFKAMFDAIRRAKRNINLEYFIFENVESGGIELGDLLIKKRRQGVTVNVIYDGFGSGDTPPEFFERLKKARIKVLQFNPFNPLTVVKMNDRDHRKILVVDGMTAIVGGINLSTTYQSSGSGRSGSPEGLANAYWHDTDLEISGPVVAQLQKLFVEHWEKQRGPKLDQRGFFPSAHSTGQEMVRVIGSASAKEIPRYYVTLLSAIRNAQKNIWLTSAYFVPTDEQMADIIRAARRGVDVRILMPGKSDSNLALIMQHSHYRDLLKAGIKIYEARNEVQHSKTVVIDGVWSVIGSSNFDYRSVVFNDEVDVVVLGQKTGGELEAMFLDDTAKAREITAEKWSHRAAFKVMKETLMPLWLTTLKSNL